VSGWIHSRQIVARSLAVKTLKPPESSFHDETVCFHDETVCFHDALLRPREELMLRVNATS